MRAPARFVAPSILLAAALAGCASGLKRPVQEVTAKADSSGVQHVELHAHAFWFEPNRIVVKANAPVELRLHNGSWMIPHNFSIQAPDGGLSVDQDLRWLGGSATVRFTPTTPGEYGFFCDKDSHSKKGMTGMLIVTQ